MNKITYTWLLLVTCSTIVSAQPVEVFIRKAMDNNPGLKSLKLDYEAARLKADQLNDWPDPKVNLAMGILPIETRLGAQRLRLGVSQMIPWKGLLDARSNVARSKAEIQSYVDEVKEIDIEYAIRSSYVMLQFLEARILIIQQRIDILDALEEMAKSAVRSGKGKLSNVLFIERKREVLEADLSLIIKKMEQPTIMINRWAGRELTTKIKVSQISDNQLLKKQLIKYTENVHPQFKILDKQIEASHAKISITKYDSKPKIGVGLDYSFIESRNDVDIPGNGRDVLMPMGSISIPIHTGRFKAIRQEELIRQEAINVQKEEVKEMFEAEIEIAFSNIEYLDQIISKYQSLKSITNETLKLMRTEYKSEGTRFEELLRLEMELIDYDFEIIKAQYDKSLANVTLYKFK